MALASMQKVMVVAHRSQATALLGVLQDAGIVQILDAERAMVTKEWPELIVERKRHRSVAETMDRISKAINFLKPYSEKDATSLFAPFISVNEAIYDAVVSQQDTMSCLGEIEQVGDNLEKLASEAENKNALLAKLNPWKLLSVPLEQLGSFSTSTTFVGLLGDQHFDSACEKLTELGAALEEVDSSGQMRACIILCLNEVAPDVQKLLRSVEFEAAAFEGLSGTISENIVRTQDRLEEIQAEQAMLEKQASDLAQNKLNLQILFDHLQNLHGRLVARSTVPATDHAIFLEGWVKKKHFRRLEKLVRPFDACDVAAIEPAQGEDPPIEIDNGPMSAPFETITRLYGMPTTSDVDPTVFMAPFFALFFGICMTDAAYGLILLGLLGWLMRKIKGDRKFVVMLIFCSITTVIAGALTGGWFADSAQSLLPQSDGSIGTTLNAWRVKIMLFDPMEKPLIFIGISLALGYVQVLFGLAIAFFNLLSQKRYAEAVFEKLTWLILLNSILLYALAKVNVVPAELASVMGVLALVQMVIIFWFTERNSGLGGRLGGGAFAVFSTVFYVGDMLSYVRLMALGMVTAGLGMAVNILTKLLMDIPTVGFVLGMLMFVGGHAVNIALALLSAFVHSLRLQFVEFFPKFFTGGGHIFKPLRNHYRYVSIVKNKK
ncbi:MAG: hypothetical protein DRP52_04420 [Planctomycetota bacterium]|nr:MAG: hypothetical protein DRP52_04420 [Planctomycetota bacterium]